MKIKIVSVFALIVSLSLALFSARPTNGEWINQLGTNFVANAFETAIVENYPNADVIILADTTIVNYNADGTYSEENEYYIKANTHLGVKESRTQSFWYDAAYSNFKFDIVELIKPAVTIPLDPSKVCSEQIDSSQMNSNIYDPNSKIIQALIPDFEVGDIVHVKVTRNVTQARVPNYFADIFGLESEYPILRYRYVISGPETLPLQSVALRDADALDVTHEVNLENGRINHCWEVANVPQVFREPDMPAMYSCVGRCIVSTGKNWSEISKWYWELCEEPLNAISPELEAEVKSLIEGTEPNSPERLLKIFTYVSQKIRYMGITTETVAPGYEPHPVKMTFENKHGVCRDKAALLVTMLRLAGFNSYPVLIMVGEKLDQEVPMTFFNHAVVAIQYDGSDEYVLMDPTNESTVEIFPEYLCEKSYLVAKPDGEELKVSPSIEFKKNMLSIKTTARLEIAQDGSNALRDGHTVMLFKGINDTMYRGFFADNDKQSILEFLRRNLSRANFKFILKDFKLSPEDPSDTSQPLKLELFFDFASPLPASFDGTAAVMDLPLFGSQFGAVNMVLPDTSLLTRRFPLKLFSTCGDNEELEILLPEGFNNDSYLTKPTKKSIEAKPFEFNYSTKVFETDGTTKMLVSFGSAVASLEVAPKNYEDCRHAMSFLDFKKTIKPIWRASAIEEAKKNSQIASIGDFASKGMRNLEEDGYKYELNRVRISIDPATNEIVVNKKQRKKLFTKAGKSDYSDVSFDYFPSNEQLKLLHVATIKASGEIITDFHTNLMDKAWVGAAPAYPACKQLVLNFPNTEVGDSIEYELEQRVSVEDFSGERFYTACFAAIDEGQIEFDMQSFKEYLKRNPQADYVLNFVSNTDPATSVDFSKEQASDSPAKFVIKQYPALDDFMQANLLDFDHLVFRTKSKLDGGELATLIKKIEATGGVEKAKAKAREIKAMLGDSATEVELLTAVRDYTAKHIRKIGPSFNQILERDYLSPDRVLEEGYANDLDYAVLQYVMLKELGIASKLLLGIEDLRGDEAIISKALESCVLTDVDLVLVEANVDGKNYYPNIGSQYALEMKLLPKYCGVPLFDRDGAMQIKTYEATSILNDFMESEKHSDIVIDIDAYGMATITCKSSRSGQYLEALVKQYFEMVPELKERHHAKLVGQHSRTAMAIGDLDVDISGTPASQKYKLRMELPTISRSEAGGVRQFTLPDFCDILPSPLPFLRNYAMQRSAQQSQTYRMEIILPPKSKVLSKPMPIDLKIGDNGNNVMVKRTVEERFNKETGRYHYVIDCGVVLNQMDDIFTPKEYLDYADAIFLSRGVSNSWVIEFTAHE